MAEVGVEQDEARLGRLCRALTTLKTPEEAAAFLGDVCSAKELSALAQRLEVARLLARGTSYSEVSRATGASSTTVSRVSKCLNGSCGGYRTVLARLGEAAPREGGRPGDAVGPDS